jgi:hypothetical protein
MKLVETIRTIYHELFTINFGHSAYEQDRHVLIADEITMRPDAATLKIFTDYEMDYKFYNETLLCFIRCRLFATPAPLPKITFKKVADNLQLRFILKSGTAFLNKTEIIDAGAREVYYFSNRANAGTDMFISNDNIEVGNGDLKNVSVIQPGETCLGVIDIFSSNAINNNYELFTGASQQLRSPEYRIRFRSKI